MTPAERAATFPPIPDDLADRIAVLMSTGSGAPTAPPPVLEAS